MDSRGAAQLGQADQVLLHLKAAGHHQVGELINDQNQIWQWFLSLGVVPGDVAGAHLFHLLVAPEHLAHQATESRINLIDVDDHGRQQMRNAIKRGQLHPLGVDHEYAHLVRRLGQQQRRHDGVDAYALAAAGGAGDQQMGQRSQVQRHRVSSGVLTQGDGQAPIGRNLTERLGLHHIAEMHFAGGRRGHLQAHQGFPGDRSLDAQVGRLESQGQVLFPHQDALNLDAVAVTAVLFARVAFLVHPAGHQPETYDSGPRSDVLHLNSDTVLGQSGFNVAGHRLQRGLVRVSGHRRRQTVHRR